MDENFAWFTKADLTKYEDKYICIVNKKVVSANADPEIAFRNAKRKHPDKEIAVWKVPQGETFIFHLT